MSNDHQGTIFRRKPEQIHDFGRFKSRSENFDRQFCNLYKTRLSLLKERLLQKIELKWGKKVPVIDIVDLVKTENEENEKCIIIGTIYKFQELKPSCLKEICDELQLPTQPRSITNYNSTNDCLFLEDDNQRIKLTGNCCIGQAVTGIICGVIGHDLKNGSFWVDDWCFPGYYPKISKPMMLDALQTEGNILIVSGLHLSNIVNFTPLNLLTEWITGMAGNKEEQKTNSKLTTIIIAGNSIRDSTGTFSREEYFKQNNSNSATIMDITLTLKKLDNILSQILKNCQVIIMPGEFDPSSHLMPQHPLHFQILPQSSRYTTFHSVTNPWVGKIKSRIISGSSGQPILDISKVADLEYSPIHWLEKTLQWQHYAPTSPDTLDIYPYFDCDPFVLQECPDIYFAGNMENYETKMLTGDERQEVRLICVPPFAKTHTAVLVNLQTLNVETISFGVSL